MSESDKQLTVAELLARSGGQRKEGGRRRRRRLEDGGVSVAELTGSLPKVEEAPVDSRHTAQPLEAENADRPEPVAFDDTTRFAAVTADDEPAGKSAAADAAPQVPEQTEAAKAPAEDAALAPASSEDVTGTAVEAADEAATETAVDEPTTEGLERPAADTEVTGEIKVVEDIEPAVEPEPARAQQVMPTEAERDVEDSIAGFDYPLHDSAELEQADDAAVEELDAEEEESSVGMGSVILMALVGIVLGAVIFIGFQFLWDSGFNRLIVAVLALAVTALMVGVAHAMRTTRDGLSMVLAGVVGLLMTFGPAIVVMM